MISKIKPLIPSRFRPIGYLIHLTWSRTNGRVRSGPFTGMQYISGSVGSCYIPKLLGIYESELAAEVEFICQRKPTLIVDVGAAEGYYAVGLARRNPQAKVIAFEMEPKGQASIQQMGRLNQVDSQVEIRGKCEPADLAAALAGDPQPVVICDVEGYEEKLLDPVAVPALVQSCILVELHEVLAPGITEKLKQRFSATHEIKLIWQEPRSRSQFPWRTFGTALLPKSYLDWSVDEWRSAAGRMSWLWIKPL